MENQPITYKDAGVDVERGYRAVELIKGHVKSTYTKNVIGDLGGFGGLFGLDLTGIQNPVLVSGTDGVGTKLQIAFMSGVHDTIGIDCVAMCVNDIVCQGATPLFFLDYIATGRLVPERAADIVKGIAQGCKEAGCALIGGETAEMPGFYKDNEYDVAGFSVGLVDRDKIITGQSIEAGDMLIGISSSGLHSNGFSLVRKLLFEVAGYKIDSYVEDLGSVLASELLKPTRIYAGVVKRLLNKINIKGLSHITGGGFIENIPRMLPREVSAKIDINSLTVPNIFRLLQNIGKLDDKEMFNTFNMGIGLVMVVDKNDVNRALAEIKQYGYHCCILGEVISGQRGVVL